MKKAGLVLFVTLLFLSLNVHSAEAAIITIDPDGSVVWNVLSLQDELQDEERVEDFAVRKIAEVNNAGNDLINVEQKDGTVKLSVGTGETARQISVEKKNEDSLIEIEERPTTQKLTIGKNSDQFTIKQGRTSVYTILPIQVDPRSARLSLRTSTGDNFLYVMPREAIIGVLRTRVVSAVRESENIELVEDKERLVYKIPGEKIISILDIYNYSFNVDSYVSAQTGELLEVDAPTWYKIFGFLITQQVG